MLGDGARLEDAAALARLEPPRAVAAATALAEADLLRAYETIAFVHPVVQAAVYGSLGPLGQRDAHARAVRLLTRAGRPAERVAAHVMRSPPAADPEAVAILRAAAVRSMADGATGLAADYLERALDEPPRTGQRLQVLVELSTAERRLSPPQAAGHLREAFTLTDDPVLRTRIALRLGAALAWAGRVGEEKTVFEQVLADPSLNAGLMRKADTGLVLLGLFEPELVPLARERLSRFDPEAPLTDFDSRTLLACAAYDQARGTGKDTAVEWVMRLVADRAILDENGRGAFAEVGGVLLAADRLDEAQRLAEDLTQAGEESGSVLLACGALWLQADILHHRGALADAEAYFSSTVDTAVAHGFITPVNSAGAQYAILLADRGDGKAAWQMLRRLGLDGPLRETGYLYEARLAAGVARVACGQVHEGIDQLRAVGRRWEAIGARNPDMAPWRPHLAQALLLLGERDEARALAEEHTALARAWGAGRSPVRCGSRDWPLAARKESCRSGNRPRWLAIRPDGLNWRCRWSSWARPNAARTAGPQPGNCFRRAWRWPTNAVPVPSRTARWPNFSRPALARGGPPPAAAIPSLPASCASLTWPALARQTARSHSASSLPRRRSRPTSAVSSANCTSARALSSPWPSPANKGRAAPGSGSRHQGVGAPRPPALCCTASRAASPRHRARRRSC